MVVTLSDGRRRIVPPEYPRHPHVPWGVARAAVLSSNMDRDIAEQVAQAVTVAGYWRHGS